jgi:hypothetical protein
MWRGVTVVSQWSLLEQIIAGLLVAAVGFVAARYWAQRRLYVVTRYYRRSELSAKGKAVSFTILNRGHRAENNVRLELDPALQYALLAASTDAIALRANVLEIDALPARDDISAVLQVDGGDFDNDNVVRFNSTEALGRVFKKLEDAPPPPGVAPALTFFILALMGGIAYMAYQTGHDEGELHPIFNPTAAFELSKEQQDAVAALKTLGWLNTDEFVRSEMEATYGKGEFPVSVTAFRRVGDFVLLRVDIQNRGDDWLTVTASATSTQSPVRGSCATALVNDYFHDKIVPARSRVGTEMIAYVPTSARLDEQVIRFSTTLGYREKTIFNLYRYIDVSEVPADTQQRAECQVPQGKSPSAASSSPR